MGVKERINAERRRAVEQFGQMARAGQVPALDRFGNPIMAGSALSLHAPHDLIVRVTEVTPALEPGLPPGAMKLTLAFIEPYIVMAGTPNRTMLCLEMPGSAEASQDDHGEGQEAAGADGGAGGASSSEGAPALASRPPSGPLGLVDGSGRPIRREGEPT